MALCVTQAHATVWKLYDIGRVPIIEHSHRSHHHLGLVLGRVLLPSPTLPICAVELRCRWLAGNLLQVKCRVHMCLLSRRIQLSYSEVHKSRSGRTVLGVSVSASQAAQHQESEGMLVPCQFGKVT